MGEKPQC